MKDSEIKLNNLRNILHRVGELDNDIQYTLPDSLRCCVVRQEIHHQLMDIADRIEAEIGRVEADDTVK